MKQTLSDPTDPEPAALCRWIDRQFAVSAAEVMRSVSPVASLKTRAAFGKTIRPARGSLVAAPAVDGDPDYFFHWHRDSALVVDGLRRLIPSDPGVAVHFRDFVGFNQALERLDGRKLVDDPAWRAAIDPAFARYVRDDVDLAAAHGTALLGEVRFEADGTLDIQRWGRPQNDGPALRALALLRWSREVPDAAPRDAVAGLVEADVAHILAHWRQPCVDIWEEEAGHHYYTLRVQAAALEAAQEAAATRLDEGAARHCRDEAGAILATLDGYWLAEEGFYRSRVLDGGERSTKELDMAVILATIHAGGRGATHSVADPRLHATLARLDAAFAADYAINRARPPGRGTAMGRYPGDVYVSGGAWYITTLGAAEFCFRAAATGHGTAPAGWLARGDAYLETVRAFTPPDGTLSEQFDQTTGAQTSAKDLAWSHAAVLTCIAARRAVAGEDGGGA